MKLQKSSGNFQLAPEGTTRAVVVDVVDMGMQKDTFNEGELIPKTRIVFQTEDEMDDGRPFIVSTYPVKQSINRKANLYDYIKSIIGRDLEESDFDEEGDIDIDNLLLGKNANITITHTDKGDKHYANITKISPLTNKDKKDADLVPRDYVRQQDRDSFNPEEIEASSAAAAKM